MKYLHIVLFIFIGNHLNAQTQKKNAIADQNLVKYLLSANENNSIAVDSTYQSIKLDANKDGIISSAEAEKVAQLNIEKTFVLTLKGIDIFKNLKILLIKAETLKDLNGVENLKKLEYIDCSFNKSLGQLSFKNLPKLETIDCMWSGLTKLELSDLPNLKKLHCGTNDLKTLDLSQMNSLTDLICESNGLTELSINHLRNLKFLRCENNLLRNLDLSNLKGLEKIQCSYNELSQLNFENFKQLTDIDCAYNRIKYLNIKTNGKPLTNLRIEGNRYINTFCYNDFDKEIITRNNKENIDLNTCK